MLKLNKFQFKQFSRNIGNLSRESRLKSLQSDGMDYLPIKFEDHYPVFWRNVMRIINDNIYGANHSDLSLPKVFGDFTLGCGNHTQLILDNFENSFVVGVDLDEKMVNYTSKKLDRYIQNDRLIIVEDTYVCVEDLKISELFEGVGKFANKKKFDFMLVDLGFNSMQLEHRDKGLSFKNLDSNLDMRYDMNNETKAKASDILNNSSELELMEIFSKYGDEKNHEAIAKSVIKYREDKRFETVEDFIKVIDTTYDYGKDNARFNIYTRLFQALRICVNYELTNIQRFLNKAFFNMENGGILVVISFHSAEDKIVKNVFKELEKIKLGQLIIKKGEKPCKDELEENSRSHSAILRAIRFNPSSRK